jgi:hypothetical protein
VNLFAKDCQASCGAVQQWATDSFCPGDTESQQQQQQQQKKQQQQQGV